MLLVLLIVVRSLVFSVRYSIFIFIKLLLASSPTFCRLFLFIGSDPVTKEAWHDFLNLIQRCTRFLHACSSLCKCANWLCRTCTLHHTVAGRSSVSLTESPFAFPSNCRCGFPLTSYMPGRAVPSRARHSSTHHRTLCAVHGLCTSDLIDPP
jgi:hypothetical protein